MCAIWYIYGHPRGILIMNPLTPADSKGECAREKDLPPTPTPPAPAAAAAAIMFQRSGGAA